MAVDHRPQKDGWDSWANHVLAELTRHNEWNNKLSDQIAAMSNEISMLKVKAGVWGAIAGLIPAAITIIIVYLSKAPK